jgi:hypothetical protein
MRTGSQATLPSFTGEPSGENATEVMPSTDDPYLIQAALPHVGIPSVPLFRLK